MKTEEDLEAALADMERARVQAVEFAVPAGAVIVKGDPARLVAAAARHRMPAIYAEAELVRAGGLLSYGPSYTDLSDNIEGGAAQRSTH